MVDVTGRADLLGSSWRSVCNCSKQEIIGNEPFPCNFSFSLALLGWPVGREIPGFIARKVGETFTSSILGYSLFRNVPKRNLEVTSSKKKVWNMIEIDLELFPWFSYKQKQYANHHCMRGSSNCLNISHWYIPFVSYSEQSFDSGNTELIILLWCQGLINISVTAVDDIAFLTCVYKMRIELFFQKFRIAVS